MSKKVKKSPSKTSPNSEYAALRKRIRKVDDVETGSVVLLYGRSGTGKTTIASTFPTPMLLIDIREDGVDSVKGTPGVNVLEARNWDDVELAYWMLQSDPGEYETVVIDSISMAQTMLVEQVLEETGKDAMTRQLWGEVSGRLQSLIMGLRDLPMNVVFIAHDRARTSNEEEDGDQLDPEVGPALIPSVAKILNGAVKVIGNTYIAEEVQQQGARITTKVEYRMRLGPHPIYITKVRSPRGAEIPAYIANPTYEDILAITKGEYNGKEAPQQEQSDRKLQGSDDGGKKGRTRRVRRKS